MKFKEKLDKHEMELLKMSPSYQINKFRKKFPLKKGELILAHHEYFGELTSEKAIEEAEKLKPHHRIWDRRKEGGIIK